MGRVLPGGLALERGSGHIKSGSFIPCLLACRNQRRRSRRRSLLLKRWKQTLLQQSLPLPGSRPLKALALSSRKETML